jgi:hypothetical protein
MFIINVVRVLWVKVRETYAANESDSMKLVRRARVLAHIVHVQKKCTRGIHAHTIARRANISGHDTRRAQL